MIIKAKKSLGQNFLFDKNILKIIINCADIRNKNILEIGPGTGNLTTEIIKKKPKKLLLIEKDKTLLLQLKKKYSEEIIYIHEDVLNINENLLSKEKLTVFGNLPYNISTEILTKWIMNLNSKIWFDKLILMFQKEVADRILASHNTKNYGRLSIISSWKMDVEKIIDVNPSSFFPSPKIKSSLLLFKPKNSYYKLKNAKNLEHITNIFFNQRRKMIKKPLKILFKNYEKVAEELNLNLNLRPQNLSCLTYYKICSYYEKLL